MFTNFCIFIHNFGCRYSRKPFKGSKDVHFDLVSEKNFSQKNGSMGWGPGPNKIGQENAKTPPLVTFLPANAKSKTKKFFFLCQLEDSRNGQWSMVNGQWSMVNGLLFHMTQLTSKSIIKAIACSKPTISEH